MRLLLLSLMLVATSAGAQQRVAFFGITLLDTSLQSSTSEAAPAEPERIAMLERLVTERFLEEGYVFVDLEPVRQKIDRRANLAKCNGCDSRIAATLGADYSLVGEVQKVSNLILAINLQLRSAETGRMVRGGVVDIRGNTDESWMRGMRYILKNRIFVRDEK